MRIRKSLRARGMALALALTLAAGAPAAYVALTPVEVSAKAVKKGLKQENGKFYFYVKGKKVKNSWQTVKGKRYYFKGNGAAAIGWTKIQNKAYYFNTKGVMAKNKTVDKVRLNSKGQASLTQRVQMLLLVQNVTGTGANSAQAKEKRLRACYDHMVNKCSYRPRETPSGKPSKWEVKYAYEMLRDKGGNCYSYAAGFAMLARGCGYDAKLVVGSIQKPGEELIAHAWVEIGGKVYDPQTQQTLQKNSGLKVDLYGKSYGDTGEVKYAQQ